VGGVRKWGFVLRKTRRGKKTIRGIKGKETRVSSGAAGERKKNLKGWVTESNSPHLFWIKGGNRILGKWHNPDDGTNPGKEKNKKRRKFPKTNVK